MVEGIGMRETSFAGLVITLYKGMPCLKIDNTNDYDFYMFGCYDWAKVCYVDHWFDLRPGGKAKDQTVPSILEDVWDEFSIKLYFPRQGIIDGYDEQGFFYDGWKAIGKDPQKRAHKHIMEIYPFISLSLLSVDKGCINRGDSITGYLVRRIKRIADERDISLPSVHCAVMPSIGHSEFAILFISDNPMDVKGILDPLREKDLADEEDRTYRVSGIYTLFAFWGDGWEREKTALPARDSQFWADLRPVRDEKVSVDALRNLLLNGIWSENDGSGLSDLFKKEKAVLQECVVPLQDCFGKHSLPIRLANGLQSVMKLYLSQIQHSRNLDMQVIIHGVFEILRENIIRTKELDEARGDEFEWILELKSACEIIRERIGNYLADMQRSDGLYMEAQSPMHPSIGSSTKLLFFYNQFINETSKILLTTERNNKEDKYCFIVVSGGCDETKAIDVFSYLDPWVDNNESLVIITMPEMSLYDFRGSCFRLLHEILHFCGERNRKHRSECFKHDLSHQVAKKLFADYFEPNLCEWWTEEVLKDVSAQISDKAAVSGIEKKALNLIVESIKTREVEAATELDKRLDEAMKGEDAALELLYGRNIYALQAEIIKGILNGENDINDIDSFTWFVYKTLLEIERKASGGISDMLEQLGILFSGADVLRGKAEYNIRIASEGKYDADEMHVVQSIFRFMCSQEAEPNDVVQSVSEYSVTINDIIANLSAVYKECYADCLAAKILGISVADFILSFVYESWNLDFALPKTPMQSMRLGVELEELYGIRGGMNHEHKKAIMERIEYFSDNGFNYDRSNGWTEHLFQTIDDLLKEYELHYREDIKHARDYIHECCEMATREIYWGEAAVLRNLFEKNGGMVYSGEFLYDILTEIRNCWKAMGQASCI